MKVNYGIEQPLFNKLRKMSEKYFWVYACFYKELVLLPTLQSHSWRRLCVWWLVRAGQISINTSISAQVPACPKSSYLTKYGSVRQKTRVLFSVILRHLSPSGEIEKRKAFILHNTCFNHINIKAQLSHPWLLIIPQTRLSVCPCLFTFISSDQLQ